MCKQLNGAWSLQGMSLKKNYNLVVLLSTTPLLIIVLFLLMLMLMLMIMLFLLNRTLFFKKIHFYFITSIFSLTESSRYIHRNDLVHQPCPFKIVSLVVPSEVRMVLYHIDDVFPEQILHCNRNPIQF